MAKKKAVKKTPKKAVKKAPRKAAAKKVRKVKTVVRKGEGPNPLGPEGYVGLPGDDDWEYPGKK
jgi:hypothetical protein